MSKYKIGVTEAGDAGLDLAWIDKLDEVDGAILITKHITEPFIQAVMKTPDKIIVHATITGHGGTVIEPNVPPMAEAFNCVNRLVALGFPKDRIVIRVDPIIPTTRGIETARKALFMGAENGFRRFRVSVIDMYPHVRKRFKELGLPLIYGDGFSPSPGHLYLVDKMLVDFKATYDPQIESCAEKLRMAVKCGCVSDWDLILLGLDPSDCDSVGFQRKDCLCYSGKVELLNKKHPCGHQCVYCFWRD